MRLSTFLGWRPLELDTQHIWPCVGSNFVWTCTIYCCLILCGIRVWFKTRLHSFSYLSDGFILPSIGDSVSLLSCNSFSFIFSHPKVSIRSTSPIEVPPHLLVELSALINPLGKADSDHLKQIIILPKMRHHVKNGYFSAKNGPIFIL